MKGGVDLDPQPIAQSVHDPHDQAVFADLDHPKPLERVRVIVHAVPRVESVRDHITRLARRFHPHHGVEEHLRSWREDRPRRGILSLLGNADPGEHSVVVRLERTPGAVPAIAELEAVPRAHESALAEVSVRQAGSHVRAGVGGDPQGAIHPPRNQLPVCDRVRAGPAPDHPGAVHRVPPSGRQCECPVEMLLDQEGVCLYPVGSVQLGRELGGELRQASSDSPDAGHV